MPARIEGESRGCYCGSVIVAASNARASTEDLIRSWTKLHPDGRTLNGAYHEEVTVSRARELRRRRGQEVERSSIEIRPP
jgi:hypothetical protein